MAKDPFHRYEAAEEMENDLKTAFDPDRLNEKRFTIPSDDEMTKAIPIIKESAGKSSSQSGGGEEEAAPLSKKKRRSRQKQTRRKKERNGRLYC
jgi:hypothetical protein